MLSHHGRNVLFLCAGWLLLLAPASARADDELPDGPGKVPLQRICSACHAPEVVVGKHETKERWGEIVSSMVERGAVGTDAELDQIVDYLAKNFPSKAADAKPDSSPANPKK